MRAPITDKHLLEMMWERFPEIMQRGAEQPTEQEPDINYCPTCAALSKDFEDTDLSTQPAPVQRSPVAFIRDDGSWDGTVLEIVWDKKDDGFIYKPLYTSPPQRTWVGLTPEEVQEIHDTYHKRMGGPQEFASMVEAKLKEKNT